MRQKKVTKAGLNVAQDALAAIRKQQNKASIPPDILKALKKDPVVWKIFSRFPASYKRIRIGWIDGSQKHPKVFSQRLNYFLKMTVQNKRFGMVQ